MNALKLLLLKNDNSVESFSNEVKTYKVIESMFYKDYRNNISCFKRNINTALNEIVSNNYLNDMMKVKMIKDMFLIIEREESKHISYKMYPKGSLKKVESILKSEDQLDLVLARYLEYLVDTYKNLTACEQHEVDSFYLFKCDLIDRIGGSVLSCVS